MRIFTLMIVTSAGIPLLAGCSLGQQLLSNPFVSGTPLPDQRSINPAVQVSGAAQAAMRTDRFDAARKLAWEAAVLVQSPPHPATTWQKARVNWRQAIRLLEEIPEGTAISAQVQEKLATYRSNYAAISDRLIAEQAAAEKLQTAQTLAWQAAVTVQNPPHPLKIWQRASRKWQEAIALLETIPPTTATYERSQEKLTIYRRNYTSINQRITTETEALRTLKQFSEIATQLNHLPTTATTNQTNDQIGISHEKYVGLVQTLETSLGQFSRQPEATKHTIYPSLMQAIDDYQQTLKLWQAYLDYKEENAQWLSGDIFNQIFPVSPDEIALLVQKYGIGTYSDGTKISLRFSAWAIWQQANQHVNKAQRKILNSN